MVRFLGICDYTYIHTHAYTYIPPPVPPPVLRPAITQEDVTDDTAYSIQRQLGTKYHNFFLYTYYAAIKLKNLLMQYFLRTI